MYWAYTTMTTVGYGDISSVTVAEKVGRLDDSGGWWGKKGAVQSPRLQLQQHTTSD